MSSQNLTANGKPHASGDSSGSGMFKTVDGRTIEIRNVWESNLEEEMSNIRDIIEKYPYIGMVM